MSLPPPMTGDTGRGQRSSPPQFRGMCGMSPGWETSTERRAHTAGISGARSVRPRSAVVEETWFPGLHGTLVKVGGHSFRGRRNARHVTNSGFHTQVHNKDHAGCEAAALPLWLKVQGGSYQTIISNCNCDNTSSSF